MSINTLGALLAAAASLAACASSPETETAGDSGAGAVDVAAADGGAAGPREPVTPRPGSALDDPVLDGRTAGRGRAYPGFLPGGFATEPLALLPPSAVTMPGDLGDGSEGEALRRELERIVTDRLPGEIRILHTRAPVLAFRDWAGVDEMGPRAGYLQSVLGWTGQPGAAGELPPLVGDSVEELGDRRGVRYFLFPRALTVARRDPFHYSATIEAFVLDARGERVVWAGEGSAAGRIAEGDPESPVAGVVRDAAVRAAASLAARLPGSARPGGNESFTDVETGAGLEGR